MAKKTVRQAESSDLTVPQDRIEGFLAKAAGLVATMPEGEFSRLERYLALIAEGGGTAADIEELKQEMQDLFVPKTIGPTPIANFTDGVDGAILGKCIVDIEPMQVGSGDPSPTNVRPISGWTGANVRIAGKNLFDYRNAPIYSWYFRNGTITTSGAHRSTVIQVAPDRYYTVSGNGLYAIGCSDTFPIVGDILSPVSTGGPAGTTKTIKAGPKSKFLVIWFHRNDDEGTVEGDFQSIQVELGETATEYSSFAGDAHTISFGEAGTVYGGTLDVGTGVLTVDRGMVTATSVTGGYGVVNGYGRFDIGLPEDSKGGQYTNSELVKTNYLPAYGYTPGAAQWETPDKDFLYTYLTVNKRFGLVLNGIETTADANTYLTANPLTVIYELQTPQTYQLTPAQVRTLLGLNNIYADTGDIEIEYRGDIPNLYSLIG